MRMFHSHNYTNPSKRLAEYGKSENTKRKSQDPFFKMQYSICYYYVGEN